MSPRILRLATSWCCVAFVGVVLTGLVVPSATAAKKEKLPDGLFHMDFSDQELNEIQALFPEYGGLNPSFINSATDPNIHALADMELTVTFIDEGAGFKNTFGYFVFDDDHNILYEETLFPNASKEGAGGSLVAGDSLVIGNFEAGTNIGFWLQADGANKPDGPKFYTVDELNPDGLRHMAIVQDPDNQRLIIGIEDIYNLGDEDYNDIVFTFTANPFSAIDTSNIPTGAPEPASAVVAVLFLGMIAVGIRRGLLPLPGGIRKEC